MGYYFSIDGKGHILWGVILFSCASSCWIDLIIIKIIISYKFFVTLFSSTTYAHTFELVLLCQNVIGNLKWARVLKTLRGFIVVQKRYVRLNGFSIRYSTFSGKWPSWKIEFQFILHPTERRRTVAEQAARRSVRRGR